MSDSTNQSDNVTKAASIKKDSVVAIHYTLSGDDNQVIDSSVGSDPLAYLHGHSQIVPGLESALNGKKVGDKLKVSVKPEDGYGAYNPQLTQSISKKDFPPKTAIEVGAMFEASGPDGEPMVISIVGVEGDTVSIDGNHPLAGKTLHFDVEIVSLRAATKGELDHGHAHGPGGAHHE